VTIGDEMTGVVVDLRMAFHVFNIAMGLCVCGQGALATPVRRVLRSST
jgi:hypothetical protein